MLLFFTPPASKQGSPQSPLFGRLLPAKKKSRRKNPASEQVLDAPKVHHPSPVASGFGSVRHVGVLFGRIDD